MFSALKILCTLTRMCVYRLSFYARKKLSTIKEERTRTRRIQFVVLACSCLMLRHDMQIAEHSTFA